MTQIDSDPNLVVAQGGSPLPRAAAEAEDFAQPFVETVKVIREWDGEAANDQFGWIARGRRRRRRRRRARHRHVRADQGDRRRRPRAASTCTRRRGGKLIWSVDGKPGDQLGTGVEAAGDTNHDGVPDVIASAPGAGKAYVYSGKDGRVLLTLSAEKSADNFGRHVSGVGDVDGDGYADVIVGAPGNGAGGEGAGRAYVYSGKDGHVLLTLTGERARTTRSAAPSPARGRQGRIVPDRRRAGRGAETCGSHLRLQGADVEAGVRHRRRRRPEPRSARCSSR